MPIDKRATVAWYNVAAPLYSFFRNITKKIDRDVMPYAIDRLSVAPADLVLDAGTGPGTYAIEIAKRCGAKVVGIDISPKFVSLAEKNAAAAGVRGVAFLQGDLESLPFPDGRFSKIICAGALQAVTDRAQAARELNRVLSPGGRAVIVEPHKRRSVNDRLFLILMYLTGLFHWGLRAISLGQLTDHFFDEESLGELLRAAGFSEVEIADRAGAMCAVCHKAIESAAP